MVCSNCGHPLGPDDQFCGGCGAYLTDSPQAPEGETRLLPETAAQPGAEPRSDPATQSEGRSGPSAGLIAAGIAAVALVGLMAIWVLRPDGAQTEAVDPAATTSPAATTTTSDPGTAATTPPTESPSVPPRSPVDLPGAAQECGNIGALVVYRGNETTSCPFAENVGRAFAALEQPVTAEVTLSGVSSPVTGLDYDLTCAYTTPIRCEGGNNAAIYLVPAS